MLQIFILFGNRRYLWKTSAQSLSSALILQDCNFELITNSIEIVFGNRRAKRDCFRGGNIKPIEDCNENFAQLPVVWCFCARIICLIQGNG